MKKEKDAPSEQKGAESRHQEDCMKRQEDDP